MNSARPISGSGVNAISAGEDPPAAVAVGEDAERDPHQRAEHDRDRDGERELGVGQAELVLQVGAERAEQRPGVEADAERERRERRARGVAARARRRCVRTGHGPCFRLRREAAHAAGAGAHVAGGARER